MGFHDRAAAGLDVGTIALPAVSIAIDFGERGFTVENLANPGTRYALTSTVSGLSPGSVRIRSEQVECVEIRLSPVHARRLLGIPLGELDGVVVDLEDLCGRPARHLRKQLASATTWDQRFSLTEHFLAQRDSAAPPIAPEIAESWHRVMTSRGQVTVDALARSSGWSRKRLWSRFSGQIGLTPKRATMQIRFRSAIELLFAGNSPAEVAAVCGYADQSHLHRDASAFAAGTPRTVIDQLTAVETLRAQAWGTFFQD